VDYPIGQEKHRGLPGGDVGFNRSVKLPRGTSTRLTAVAGRPTGRSPRPLLESSFISGMEFSASGFEQAHASNQRIPRASTRARVQILQCLKADKKAPLGESCLDGSRSGKRRGEEPQSQENALWAQAGVRLRPARRCRLLIFWTEKKYRAFHFMENRYHRVAFPGVWPKSFGKLLLIHAGQVNYGDVSYATRSKLRAICTAKPGWKATAAKGTPPA
jgi:hypothetical protein